MDPEKALVLGCRPGSYLGFRVWDLARDSLSPEATEPEAWHARPIASAITLQRPVGFPVIFTATKSKVNWWLSSIDRALLLSHRFSTMTTRRRLEVSSVSGLTGISWLPSDCGRSAGCKQSTSLVAEWIHFTLFGIILPTIKLRA